MESTDLTPKDKEDVKNVTILNLKHLVSLNAAACSRLIIKYFSFFVFLKTKQNKYKNKINTKTKENQYNSFISVF